jgi:hypothetical protein
MKKRIYKGGCLCGKVRFEITGVIEGIVFCHCSRCRKAQGSAFAANGNVESNEFRIITGAELLTGYESTPQQTKYFCRICGSPILSKTSSQPDKVRIRLGTIDSDIVEKPEAHIFIKSKANWEQIEDNLPQYDEYEPGRN